MWEGGPVTQQFYTASTLLVKTYFYIPDLTSSRAYKRVYKYSRYCQFVSTLTDNPYCCAHLGSTPLRDAYCTGPPSTRRRSLLRMGGSSSSGKVCGELGVNKLLDTNDLVTPRSEREDVYRFAVELMPSREFAVEP